MARTLGVELTLEELADRELRAAMAERERCAKIAETEYRGASWHGYYVQAGDVIAAKIRNQGTSYASE